MSNTKHRDKESFRQWVQARLAFVYTSSLPMNIEEAQGRSEETSAELLRMNKAAQLGDQYLAERMYEDAKRQYEIAWRQTELGGVQTKIGEVNLFLGKFEDAIESFIEEIHYRPYHLQARGHLNNIKWFLDQLPSELDDETARAVLLAGMASFALRKYSMLDEAIEAFERVVELVPNSAIFRRILGDLYDEDGAFVAASKEHMQSYELNPNDTEPHHLFGSAAHNKHEFDRLIHDYESSGVPGSAYRLAFIADCLVKAKRVEEALAYYRSAALSDPEDSHFWILYTGTLRRLERYTEAVEAYKEATQSVPVDVDLWIAYAGTLYQVGRYSEAVGAFKEAIQIEPVSEESQLVYADALAKTKAYEEASAVYLAVEQKNPNSFACQIRFAKLMIEAGNPPAAIEHLERAIAFEPNNTEAHRLLGEMYEQQGQIDKSIKHYQKLVEINPYRQDYHRLLDRARGHPKHS